MANADNESNVPDTLDDDALSFQPDSTLADEDIEIVDEVEDETPAEEEEEAPAEEAAADADADDEDEDDDLEAADLDDDEDEEEDLKGYSKNVQKRIKREIRLRREREEELADIKARAADYITKVHEDGKKQYSQLEEWQKKHDDMQDTLAATIESSLKEKSEFLLERIRRAEEEGDTDLKLRSNAEYTKVQQQLFQLETLTRDIRGSREKREKPANVWELPDEVKAVKAQPGAAAQPQRQAPTPRGAKWIEQRKWFGKEKYSDATEFARAIDRKLVAEGLNPNSKEYFVELDRRIARRFPELYKTKKPAVTTGAPVSSGASRSTTGTSGKRKVTLTKADYARMARFNLDPKNPEHRLAWAKQKGA